MIYLLSGFSTDMLNFNDDRSGGKAVEMSKVKRDYIRGYIDAAMYSGGELKIVVGDKATAKIYTTELGTRIPYSPGKIELKNGDVVLMGEVKYSCLDTVDKDKLTPDQINVTVDWLILTIRSIISIL